MQSLEMMKGMSMRLRFWIEQIAKKNTTWFSKQQSNSAEVTNPSGNSANIGKLINVILKIDNRIQE